jgi:hypothetical protein
MPFLLLAGIGLWFENLITLSGNTISFQRKPKEWVDTLTQGKYSPLSSALYIAENFTEQLWKDLTNQILKGGYDPRAINLACIGPDELSTVSRIYQARCLEKPAKGASTCNLDSFLDF